MARLLVPDLAFGPLHAFWSACAAVLMMAAERGRDAPGWATFWALVAVAAGLAMWALAQVGDAEEDDRDGC